MSGLALFFKDIDRKSNDGQSTNIQEQASSVETSYQTSLRPPIPLGASNQFRENPKSLTPVCLSWETYRSLMLDEMEEYLSYRIIAPDDESEPGSESSANPPRAGTVPRTDRQRKSEVATGDEEASDDEPETQPRDLETQPHDYLEVKNSQDQEDGSAEDGSRESSRQLSEAPIPHEMDAVHTVSYVADLDLHTESFDLRLGIVSRVWKAHSTRRQILRERLTYPNRVWRTRSLQADRVSVDGCEDDGPLSIVFKQVLQLEVRQVHLHVSELRQRAEYLQDVPTMSKRVKIFLYDKYAEKVQEILNKRNDLSGKRRTELLISLQHVTARSIVPYVACDWYDRHDLADCCICLGDNSNAKVGKTRIRFDDWNTKLSIGWVEGDNNHRGDADHCPVVYEWTFQATPGGMVSTPYESGQGPLAKAYSSWKEDSSTSLRSGQDMRQKQRKPTSGDGSDKENSSERTADARQDSSQQAARSPPRTPREKMRTPLKSPTPRKQRTVYVALDALRATYATHKALDTAADSCRPKDPCVVNVFGVVIGFGIPYLTTRGQWIMSVHLVDESLPLAADEGLGVEEPVRSISINIFAKERSALPDLSRGGDVLRLHRVHIQDFNGDIQLVGRLGSSYVVFRGDQEDLSKEDWTVLPTAKAEFEMTPQDRTRFIELWKWGQKRFLSHATMRLSHSFRLSEISVQGTVDEKDLIEHNIKGDITALVCAVIPVPSQQISGVTPRGFLRIWDGTGGPFSDPPPPTTNAKSLIERGDPPSDVLVKLASVVRKIRFVKDNMALEPPPTVAGRVVNLAVWEEAAWDFIIRSVPAGSFVRLRNIAQGVIHDVRFRCLMLYQKSHLVPIPNFTYEVVRLVQDHNARLLRKDGHNPGSGFLPLNWEALVEPVGEETGRCFRTLRGMRSGPVESTFSGEVRIVDTIPSLQSVVAEGIDSIVVDDGEGRWAFRFAVAIEDESTRLLVFPSDSAGAELVGMSAFGASGNSDEAISKLRAGLAGSRNWRVEVQSVEFGGKKYFVMDSASRQDVRGFRI